MKASSIKEPMSIIQAVSIWLGQKNINQWQSFVNGEANEVIIQAVEQGETWLVFDGVESIATFNMATRQNDWDVNLWGNKTDRAYYLHRVAIKPAYMKAGIGEHILSYVEQTATSENIPAVRLDCVQSSQKLNDYYQSNGYNVVSIKDSFNLYEKHAVKDHT